MNRFYVSIHGHTKKLHEGLTRTPGSFDQTLAGIDSIAKLKRFGVDLHTSTVITDRNLPHMLDVYRLLRSHGVDQVVFNVMQANGRANTYFEQIFPSYTQIAAGFRKFLDDAAEARPTGVSGRHPSLHDRATSPTSTAAATSRSTRPFDLPAHASLAAGAKDERCPRRARTGPCSRNARRLGRRATRQASRVRALQIRRSLRGSLEELREAPGVERVRTYRVRAKTDGWSGPGRALPAPSYEAAFLLRDLESTTDRTTRRH